MSQHLEEAICGALLTRPGRLLEVDLEAPWFVQAKCRAVFIAIAELVLRDGVEQVDLAVVHRQAAEDGHALSMTDLVDMQMADGIDLPGMSRELRKVHERRMMRAYAERFVLQLRDESVAVRDAATEAIESLFDLMAPGESNITTYAEAMRKRAAAALSGTGNAELVPTGFPKLDDAIGGGFPRGGLTIIGARPGRGKSSLVQQFCENVMRRGNRALLCSPEMAWHEVGDRGLSRATRVPLSDIRLRLLTRQQREALQRLRTDKGDCLLYDYARQTSRDVSRMARRARTGGELDLVAVDYIQFLADRPQKGEARYEVLARAVRRLKGVARAVNSAMVVGAQLKRESQGREPTLADLRESGDLEQDADLVMLLCEPDEHDRVKLLVEKNRQGPTGPCWFDWCKDWTEFQAVSA